MKNIYKILQLKKINNLDTEVKDLLSFLMDHIESEEKINRNLRLELKHLRERVQLFEKRERSKKWFILFKKIKTLFLEKRGAFERFFLKTIFRTRLLNRKESTH